MEDNADMNEFEEVFTTVERNRNPKIVPRILLNHNFSCCYCLGNHVVR